MEAIRALLISIWLLSPAIFLLLDLRSGRADQAGRGLNLRSRLIAASVAINWVVFAVLLIRSQTLYGSISSTSVLTHVLLVGSCLGVVLNAKNWRLLLANAVLVTLWVTIAYAPAHWMANSGSGTVRINGQRTHATVYFGHPTDSEAVALVDIPGAEGYFLNLGSERVKLATNREFVHLSGGIWVFKSLRRMNFSEPLSPMEANQFQFRIATPDGRVIVVQF